MSGGDEEIARLQRELEALRAAHIAVSDALYKADIENESLRTELKLMCDMAGFIERKVVKV